MEGRIPKNLEGQIEGELGGELAEAAGEVEEDEGGG